MGEFERMVAAATAAAVAWPFRFELRDSQAHLICGYAGCGQSVCCLSTDTAGQPYTWTLAGIAPLVAAHVRQCHDGPVTSQPAQE